LCYRCTWCLRSDTRPLLQGLMSRPYTSSLSPSLQCSQPSRPSGIGQDGDGRQESVRPRAGRRRRRLFEAGRRRRSLSAHNKNYKKIISITILTVMQDLWASAPSILFLTLFLQRLRPLHQDFIHSEACITLSGLIGFSLKIYSNRPMTVDNGRHSVRLEEGRRRTALAPSVRPGEISDGRDGWEHCFSFLCTIEYTHTVLPKFYIVTYCVRGLSLQRWSVIWRSSCRFLTFELLFLLY